MKLFGNILTNDNTGVLELVRAIESVACTIDSQLVKSKTVKSGKFSYDYLPLDDLEEMLRPELSKLNLMLDFPATEGHQGARIISLDTGAFKASWVPICASTNIQDNGKQLTYDARYALLMGVLGRRASKDDDGAGQKGYNVTSKSTPKPSTKTKSADALF